jgi:hypothetical protein
MRATTMEDWLMTTTDAVVAGPLSPELARRMNAYWRAVSRPNPAR